MKYFGVKWPVISLNDTVEGVPHGRDSLWGEGPSRTILLWLLLISVNNSRRGHDIHGPQLGVIASTLIRASNLSQMNKTRRRMSQ